MDHRGRVWREDVGEFLEVGDEVRPHERLVTGARVGGDHGGELVELGGALVASVAADAIGQVRVGGDRQRRPADRRRVGGAECRRE